MKREKAAGEARSFQRSLSRQPAAERYLLRLFVAGSNPAFIRAIQNIRAICDEKLQGRYDLEVIDVYQHPEQARPEQIAVTPTLVRKLPLPIRKVIGDLSNTQRALAGLDIVPRDSPGDPRGC